MMCVACYETIEPGLQMLTDSSIIDSQLCMSCINIIINTRIDSYINQLRNETCQVASARMMKAGIPEFLTIDGAPNSPTVLYYQYENVLYCGKLKTNRSKEEIETFKLEIKSISNAL